MELCSGFKHMQLAINVGGGGGGTNKQSYTLLTENACQKNGLDWLLPVVTVAVLTV